MKPFIIGIDPSRKLGGAIGRIGSKPSLSVVKFGSKSSLEDVLGLGARWLGEAIDEYRPVLVAIEEPFLKEGETTYAVTALLHGLYGALVGAARSRAVRVRSVAVKTHRANVLGTSKFASRDAAKKAAMTYCAQQGWVASDDNAAEAGLVWQWACNTFAPYGVLPVDAFTPEKLPW